MTAAESRALKEKDEESKAFHSKDILDKKTELQKLKRDEQQYKSSTVRQTNSLRRELNVDDVDIKQKRLRLAERRLEHKESELAAKTALTC